jgi:hypothetical protein
MPRASKQLLTFPPADVIAEYRVVDILLYDFEDYIEAASYDADKFSALQSAIKTLALLLLERIQRFTTETALDGAPPSLRPLPPLPALPVRANISKTVTAQSTAPRSQPPPSVPEEAPAPVVVVPPSERKPSLPRQALPASKFAQAQTAVHVTEIRPERERPERPARPDRPEDLPDMQSDYGFSRPDYRPRYGSQATSPDGTFVGLDRVDLGSPISMGSLASLGRPGSAASVRTSQTSETSLSSSRRDYPYLRPRMTSLSRHDQIHEEEISSFDNDQLDSYPPDIKPYNPTSPPMSERSNSYAGRHQQQQREQQREQQQQHHQDQSQQGHQRTSSSVSRWPQADDFDASQSVVTSSQFSTSSVLSPGALTSRDSTFDKKTSISSGVTSHSSGRGSLAFPPPPAGRAIGPDSSLGLLGGICKGARAFAAGGPGQAIKKVGGSGGSQQKQAEFSQDMMFGSMLAVDTSNYSEAMSQCLHCEYKTIYSQLLQDMDSDPLAKQQCRGMTYRSRFLYKSHVVVKDFERVYFACVFCDRARATCHEGDATVFQSVDHLFRHLARHPLPLPPTPGVTVLYEADGPPANAQDFDLIIPDGPAAPPPGPPVDALDYIAGLPSGRAIKDHVRRRNERPQARPDNVSEVLQFLNGARILGVEYPDKWDGKWCQGWHDGVLGVFPSKIISLEAPDKVAQIIKSVPRSLRTGVAKWEWDPKARAGPVSQWLTFSKGHKISNLACKFLLFCCLLDFC